MKKFLSFALVLMMALTIMAVPAFAATDNNVDVDGYIGLDTLTDPDTLIDITFSAGAVEWAVTDVTAPNITAANYTIANNSTVVDLNVTLKSFTQTSATVIPGTLTLNLTGALAKTDVIGFTGGTTAYAAKLVNGTPWTYSFNGTYVGTIPATALTPVYEMVLNFAIA